MKTSRLHIIILSGLLCFAAAARGQFIGSYAITDIPHPAGFYTISPYGTSKYGNWDVYTFYGGTLDTTHAATNSINLSAMSTDSVLSQFASAQITAKAATDIDVAFDFSATGVYCTGINNESSFYFTTDGWSTQTAIAGVTSRSSVNNGTLGLISVNFFVPAGNWFGLEVFATNFYGSNGGMNALVSNFTVSAVPEPSTYAALFGLAALGFAAYRRRHRQAG